MVKQTIPELTDYQYNELRYDSAGTPIVGAFMTTVCDMLNKVGANIGNINTYNETVETAVSQYQQKTGITVTGILTTDTWKSMLISAERMSDTVTDNEGLAENNTEESSSSPHYTSFFDTENYKAHRRNHKDIVIQFGNESVTKTIKDVFMRSVSVEVDTSGNPIFEVYEFIARDIKESDETNDSLKYTSESEPSSSSDIKYNFNFGKTT